MLLEIAPKETFKIDCFDHCGGTILYANEPVVTEDEGSGFTDSLIIIYNKERDCCCYSS
jgi:hypothetical protein